MMAWADWRTYLEVAIVTAINADAYLAVGSEDPDAYDVKTFTSLLPTIDGVEMETYRGQMPFMAFRALPSGDVEPMGAGSYKYPLEVAFLIACEGHPVTTPQELVAKIQSRTIHVLHGINGDALGCGHQIVLADVSGGLPFINEGDPTVVFGRVSATFHVVYFA